MARTQSGEFKSVEGWRSVTVTYRSDAGVVTTFVGYGGDYAAALADADRQLRPGLWTRLAISQPSSVLSDLRNAGKRRNSHAPGRPGEGQTVLA